MIRFSCPACKLVCQHPTPGIRVACPTCGQHIEVPHYSEPGTDTGVPETETGAYPPRSSGAHAPSPSPYQQPASQYDDPYARPSRRMRGVGFECPYCHTDQPPSTRSQISPAGWVVFVAMLFFCFPLFFIGLLMTEEYKVCSQCGVRLG